MNQRLYDSWRALDLPAKRRWNLLALASALFLVHYTLFSPWYIEDAAISFSFARYLTLGEGLVGWPGAHRVEGFSNPTWTALLAASDLIGVNPWVSAKLFGALFGLACLPLAMLWTERLVSDRTSLLPALTPFLLAVSTQFTLWCAAGLENALFDILLVAGGYALLRESDAPRRFPWSALLLSLLAMTRPEGPMYAFVVFCAGLVAHGARHPRNLTWWLPRWLGLFLGPFLIWHTWRYLYFAWEFPNTYYAKMGEFEKFLPLKWTKRGWHYLRGYALDSGMGFLIPLFIMGLTGFRGRRALVGLGLVGITGLALLPGIAWLHSVPGWPFGDNGSWAKPLYEGIAGPLFSDGPSLGQPLARWPFGKIEPPWLVGLRTGVLLLALVTGMLIGVRRRGWPGRWMAVLATAAVLFFAHYSGGDWMDAYRWLGLAAVPLMILLADASSDLAIASRSWPIPRFTRGRLWLVPAGVALAMGIVQTHRALVRAETSPYDVHRRVTFIREAQKRLGLDHTTAMDVDMGAHMWWSGMDIVDMAGLIDVPMGHHKPNKRLDPFIAEYIFEERRPEFAHVHGNWAKRTQIPSHPAWRSDYVDIGAFPISPWTHHVGSHVRRDAFVVDAWNGPSDRAVPFSSGIGLAGWLTPAAAIATGAPLRLEVGWTATGRKRDFRAYAFLASDDALVTHELPPGYDWLPPDDWKPDEVVLGRHSIPTTGLPPGTYDLGFALTDPDTGFRAPLSGPAGTQRTEPRFARGEIRWTEVVEIVEPERARALADVGLERTVAMARIGECSGAEASWKSARRHLSPEATWQVAAAVTAQDALALCWARRAETDGSVDAIDRARQWNHREAEVLRIGSLLADRWQAEGEAALAEERLDDAHASWRDALIADPSRAWLMRRLETLRTERLGLERPKR